jgi:hypothetical protein
VVGNWSGFRTSTAGGQTWDLDQTRLHNKANEIDGTDDHADTPAGSTASGSSMNPSAISMGAASECAMLAGMIGMAGALSNKPRQE